MIAHVEIAGRSWGWWRWWVASYHQLDSEHCVRVRNDTFRKRKVDVHAQYTEDESKRQPQVHDKSFEWSWSLDYAAIMEYDAALEAIEWDWTSRFARVHHVAILLIVQNQNTYNKWKKKI